MSTYNMNPSIVLRIGGTRNRQGGFSSLVSSGVFVPATKEDNNMDRTPLIKEKPVVSIKHEQEYIVYSIIDRYVRSCDANTDGVLSIAIIIPKGFKLANGKSPYDLLMDIYNTYVSTYMELASDGRHVYKDTIADRAIFDDILNQYRLERSTSSHIVMNPNGPVGTIMMAPEKVSMLFRDSQYQEFQKFSHIEFGSQCQTSLGLEKLEVPRPKIYTVYINRKKYKTISNPDEIVTTNVSPGNDYNVTNLSFSINQLLNSRNYRIEKGQSSVSLDPYNYIINCDIPSPEKLYATSIIISGNMTLEMQERVKQMLYRGDIKVMHRSTDKPITDNSFISAKCAGKENFYLTPQVFNNLKVEISEVKRWEDRQILYIKIEAKNNIAWTSGSSSGSQGNSIGMGNGGGISSNSFNDENNKPVGKPVKTNRNLKNKILTIVAILLAFICGFTLSWRPNSKTDEIASPELTPNDSALIAYVYNKTHPITIGDSLKIYNEISYKKTRELEEKKRISEEQAKQAAKQRTENQSTSSEGRSPKEIVPPDPAPSREEVMAQVLRWANNKDLSASERLTRIQGIEGYRKALSQNERTIIESVFKDHNQNRTVGLTRTLKGTIQRIQNRNFKSYDDLKKAQEEIAKIVG